MFNPSLKFLSNKDSPPDCLLPWLEHEHSLTEKLKNITGHAVIKLLKQEWESPNWWDKFALGLNQISSVLHREILMISKNEVCWYARTIIPASCYDANVEFFSRLRQESLGVMLFNHKEVKRQQMCFYAIDSSTLEYHWLPVQYSEQANILWVRLSVFAFKENAPFYLVEIFLPGLLRALN